MDDRKKTDFVCSMIRGIDIHPVAVEMARANIRRLMPKAEDHDIAIYQGDSLLTSRPESHLLANGGVDLPLISPGNRHLVIPGWFLGSDNDIAQFVRSACNNLELPPALGAYIEKYDLKQLQDSHNDLREIVRQESDGVW